MLHESFIAQQAVWSERAGKEEEPWRRRRRRRRRHESGKEEHMQGTTTQSGEVNSSLPTGAAIMEDIGNISCNVLDTKDRRVTEVPHSAKSNKGPELSRCGIPKHRSNQRSLTFKQSFSRKGLLDGRRRGASKKMILKHNQSIGSRNSVTELKQRARKFVIPKVELAFNAVSSECCGGVNAAKHIWDPPVGNSAAKIDEEMSREEEVHEFEQCVSLLTKYGIIMRHNNYHSQSSSSNIRHPGFVGDGLLSRTCKICQVLEDEKSTVICDECQEAFHMSCCTPRVTLKYFAKEDDWYCSNCRRQKKKRNSKMSPYLQYHIGTGSKSKAYQSKLLDNSQKSFLLDNHHVSKVRLGPAHQVDVPPWTGRVEEKLDAGSPGTEVPVSEEEKQTEKDWILKEYNDNILSLGWMPAELLPQGSLQNWLQCHCIVRRGIKDRNGQKLTNDIICGKWRRAPLGVEQKENWECFCAIFWDPSHADCAIPQELPTEEILKQIQ